MALNFADIIRDLILQGHEPFFPEIDWAESVNVSWEFQTGVTVAMSGRETRVPIRRRPRMTMEFSERVNRRSGGSRYVGHHGHLAGAPVIVPDITRRHVGELTPSGQLSGDLDYPEFSPGRMAFARSDTGGVSLVMLSDVSSPGTFDTSEVSLVRGSSPTGVCAIYPAIPAQAEAPTVRYATSGVATERWSVIAYSPREYATDLLREVPDQQYRSRPLYVRPPDWGSGVAETWASAFDRYVVARGLPYATQVRRDPTRTGRYTHVLKSASEIRGFIKDFYRCMGRAGDFYAPTWTDDLMLTQPAREGDLTLRAHASGSTQLLEQSEVFKNLSIRSRKALQHAPIRGVSVNGDIAEVTLWEPVKPELDGATRVSHLLRQRMSSDVVTVRMATDEVATVEVTTVSVLEDYESLNIGLPEVTIGDSLITVAEAPPISAPSGFVATSDGREFSISGDFVKWPE